MDFDYSSFDKPVTSTDIIEYKKRHQKGATIIDNIPIEYIFASFWFLLVLSIVNQIVSGAFDGLGSILMLFVLIAYFILAYMLLSREYRKRIAASVTIDRFAEANKFSYLPLSHDETMKHEGMIFNVGDKHQYIDVLRGRADLDFEVGNYKYVIGSGRNGSTEIRRGYVVVKLNRNLPHMVLDSKKNNKINSFGLSKSSLPLYFDKDQIISLEGDFDSHFTLYAPKDYETDALYVFNPALMALFIDGIGEYDAEIIDDKLYIYHLGFFDFTKSDVFKDIFRIIDTVMNKTAHETRRYSDERVGDRNANIVHASGYRLKQSIGWLGIIMLAIYLLAAIAALFIKK